ncbi:TPA: metal ABC transporter solute-binding protein, Zn/Mn family [Photobacterium damselae]
MKKFTLSLTRTVAMTTVVCSALMASVQTHAADILTATPVTYLLASELTQSTPLTTDYLPPKRYGVTRLPNWFASKGDVLSQQAAKKAQVAVTIQAIWPQDPLYVYARQGNIRLVEVDASQAISPRAQGVAALMLDSGEISPYAWLNPTNISRMAAIVSEDLQKVWPEHAKIIEKNQQDLMIEVRKLINQQQNTLMEAGIDSVILLSSELEDFASGNQLFVVDRLTKPELEWNNEDIQQLQTLLTDDPNTWLLTSKRLSKKIKDLLPKETKILTIDSIDRWGGKGIDKENPLERWYVELPISS